jgi:hypothetical protein
MNLPLVAAGAAVLLAILLGFVMPNGVGDVLRVVLFAAAAVLIVVGYRQRRRLG